MIRDKSLEILYKNLDNVVESWSDIDEGKSLKTISAQLKVFTTEIGEFIRMIIGNEKYDSILKEKRSKFIKKVVADRKKSLEAEKANRPIDYRLRDELEATRLKIESRTRRMEDFNVEETKLIHERLLTRIGPNSKYQARRRSKSSIA